MIWLWPILTCPAWFSHSISLLSICIYKSLSIPLFYDASLSDLRRNPLLPLCRLSYFWFVLILRKTTALCFFSSVISLTIVNLEQILREVTGHLCFLSDLVYSLVLICVFVVVELDTHGLSGVRISLVVPLWFFLGVCAYLLLCLMNSLVDQLDGWWVRIFRFVAQLGLKNLCNSRRR